MIFLVPLNILSVKYQFSSTLAGFKDSLNETRHNGGYGIAETLNLRAYRHGDTCSKSCKS